MTRLDLLAQREVQVAKAMDGTSGYIADRSSQVSELGLESEYSKIFIGYAELLSNSELELEALKRCTFLAWYAYAEPTWLSGLGDLPDDAVRKVMEALDATLSNRDRDDELVEMLRYYVRVVPLPLELTRFDGHVVKLRS